MDNLFIDCFSGVSGDMLLGAFLDLGWPQKRLLNIPKRLGLKDVKINILRVKRNQISGNLVQIVSSTKDEVFRNIDDILELIYKAKLDKDIIDKAHKIFLTLAEAEAKIHGISLKEVHFHEIGAVDTIIDIIGSIIALKDLAIDDVYASAINLNRGFVNTHHGTLPLPVPAVMEILKDVPLVFIQEEHELVTPTGAAILKNIVDFWTTPNELLISKTGYGAGKREGKKIPNILRVFLFKEKRLNKDNLLEIKTVIDDMVPEHLGALFELFLEKGALDFWINPIIMKKNRPGFELTILCNREQLLLMESLIFSHTTTIGIRICELTRHILKRNEAFVDTKWGKVKVKEIFRPEGIIELVPEFEECKKISKQYKLPLRFIYDEIKSISRKGY